MLLAADADDEDEGAVAASAAPLAVAKSPLADVSPAYAAGSRYGQKRFNPVAVAVTIGLHVALIAGLTGVHFHAEGKKRERLTVVNLQPPAPPPPPPSPKQPVPKSQIAVPVPPLQIAAPAQTVVTVPEPPQEPVEVVVATPPAPPAPPAPPSVVTASDLGTRMVSGEAPRYPVESRRKHEQGTVVLSLTLGTDGAVSSISIARSSGFSRLDDAALRAVRKWRWSPTFRGGQAVMVKGQVEIPFVLQG